MAQLWNCRQHIMNFFQQIFIFVIMALRPLSPSETSFDHQIFPICTCSAPIHDEVCELL
jgi:hypothetical protein